MQSAVPGENMQSTRAVCACFAMLCISLGASAAEPVEQVFSVDLSGGKVVPAQRVMKVVKNDHVRIRATSDAPGELHLHGYRLEAKLAPGARVELAFKASATGRFRLEWHGQGPAPKTGGHHGPPLAVLEVHPR